MKTPPYGERPEGFLENSQAIPTKPSGRFYVERSFGACDCSINSGGVAAPQAGQA